MPFFSPKIILQKLVGKKIWNAQTQNDEVLTAKSSYFPLKMLILNYFITYIVTAERTQKSQTMNLQKIMDKASIITYCCTFRLFYANEHCKSLLTGIQ